MTLIRSTTYKLMMEKFPDLSKKSPAGCSVLPLSKEEQNQVDQLKGTIEEERQSAAKMGVTVERLREFRAYGKLLQAKRVANRKPPYSKERLARKICEHFNVKLL